MATTAFRKALAQELEDVARDIRLDNGASRSRSLEDHRYHAGYANGIEYAAQQVLTFAKVDDDDE